jgi:uncharacterized protein (TIGR03437 family)
VVPAGSTAASFLIAAPNATGISFQVVASLGNSTQSVTVSVGSSAISSLECSPDPDSVGTLLCTVQLAAAAPVNGATVSLQSSSPRVQVPSQLVIPGGSQAATFTALVLASDQDAQPQISASVQGATRTTSPMIIGIRPTSLTCSSGTIQAGKWLDCEVQLNSSNVPEVARLVISSVDADLELPALITTRPGQTQLMFRAYADPCAVQQDSGITVQFGSTAVSSVVSVTQASAPILSIPGNVTAMFGQLVSFTFSAVDPGGLTVILSASGLPTGAIFDPGTGKFSWTPLESQQGSYSISLTATNSASASSTGQLAIVVDSGKPVITGVYNAASRMEPACSPGSAASLAGRWLAIVDNPASNPAGTTTELGGTQVKVNGAYVSVLYASPTRVDFVCPGAAAGTLLTISAENKAGISDPASTIMHATAPGVYSTDGAGTGQGLITLAGTSLLATSRDYHALGQPAEPGDWIAIQATGIVTSNNAFPTVKIGDFYSLVQSVQAVPGMAGVYEITAEVPVGIQEGDAIPVVVGFPLNHLPFPREPSQLSDARGRGLLSNQPTIAVERPQQ